MRFLVDAQLPPALVRWLVEQGFAAEHVLDRGLHTADDRVLWSYAPSVEAVIITKDEDFALRRALQSDGPRIVWVRRGNCSRRQLLGWFEQLLPAVVEALERGETLVEIA